MTVTDDTKGFATDFTAAGGGFVPVAAVEFVVAVSELARKSDDFGDDEFGWSEMDQDQYSLLV